MGRRPRDPKNSGGVEPSPAPAPTEGESRGERNIRWIERFCRVPEGARVGQPIELEDWQKAELIRIYDNPAGTRRAILSFGRKNGKTCLAACIVLLHLCGHEGKARPNSSMFSTAQSREQASLIYQLAAKMIRLKPELHQVVQMYESTKTLVCPVLGTRYRALSAEATTSFGLSPSLIIHDELGLVRGPRSTLYEALETATGAQSDPLSIVISTQAPTDADLLSVLIDDALKGHDPHTIVKLYAAPMDADPFDEETIRLANPAFGKFLQAKEVLAMARDAERMPAREAEYRNLILNQRVEVSNPFIQPQAWRACGGDVGRLDGLETFAGLDLSEVSDLTAFVMIGRDDDGVWRVFPTFWIPEEGLAERARNDRVPYDEWVDEGWIETTPGRVVSYEHVAKYVKRMIDRYKIHKIGFDRWNMRHFKPWLEKAGVDGDDVAETFVEFGQGYQSMSPALRDLEEVILEGKLIHGNNPVMSMCVANTIIATDDAGNRKPSKKRSNGRIDGLVALAMAIGVAPDDDEIDVDALVA